MLLASACYKIIFQFLLESLGLHQVLSWGKTIPLSAMSQELVAVHILIATSGKRITLY